MFKDWYKIPENKKKFLKAHKKGAEKRTKWKITRDELYDLYWKDKLSIRQIAKRLNTRYSMVYYLLEKHKIQKRTSKEGAKLRPGKKTKNGLKAISEGVRKHKKKLWKNPKYRKKMLRVLEVARKKITPESIEKMSKSAKNNWNNEEFITKMLSSFNKKPTIPEVELNKLIQKVTKNFKYNGDFSNGITIGRKIPDFVNCNGEKKVIELFGVTFHTPNYGMNKNKKIPYHRTYQGTMKHYKKFGWDCLIIWDYELKEPNKIIEKIEKFINKPKIF